MRRTLESGIAAYRAGYLGAARRALRRATEESPGSVIAWLYLARAERDDGELERSLGTVSRALDRKPGWAPAVWHAADLKARLGDQEGAREALHQLGSLDEQSNEQLLRIGHLGARLGDTERAGRIARYLLDRAPEDERAFELAATVAEEAADARWGLALAEDGASSSQKGALAIAIRLFLRFHAVERALSLLPTLESGDPRSLLALARALRNYGFLGQALEVLDLAPPDDNRSAVRDRIAADLRIFQEGWRPSAPSPLRLRRVDDRILHMSAASLPQNVSGYSVRTHEVARAQRSLGLDPQVLTRSGFGFPSDLEGTRTEQLSSESVDEVPYHRLPDPTPRGSPVDERLCANVALAGRALEALRPAVLHPASDYHNALIALSLRQASGLPVVYEVRGFWEESWLSRQPRESVESDAYVGRRHTETSCMLDADHVVTLGEAMKREIVGRGVPEEKVTVVPNAVDPERFRAVDRDEGLARSLGANTGDTIIGYVGSLVGYEGLDDLIRAVALLAERRRDVRCLIVGEGRERANLETLAADAGIGNRVLFTGIVAPGEILAHYGLIDIFALPRRPDRVCELVTPLKPFEAMAAECAVVVSDLDALNEVVENGQTGVITPPEDPQALASALEQLIDEREDRARLARAAREWVLTERTWARNAEAYRSIYEAVWS